MHSLLDTYLEQVAAQLSALPAKRRDEELREMRQHLLNAVTVNCELGQSEKDAAANAVMQFGTAEELGGNLVWAWRREEKLNKRSLCGSAACTFAVLFFLPLLMIPFPVGPWVLCTCGATSPLIVGALCGGFFSKKGLAGPALGSALYFYGLGGMWVAFWICHSHLCHFTGSLSHVIIEFLIGQTSVLLATMFFAWAVNRWRLKRNKQSRLARS